MYLHSYVEAISCVTPVLSPSNPDGRIWGTYCITGSLYSVVGNSDSSRLQDAMLLNKGGRRRTTNNLPVARPRCKCWSVLLRLETYEPCFNCISVFVCFFLQTNVKGSCKSFTRRMIMGKRCSNTALNLWVYSNSKGACIWFGLA